MCNQFARQYAYLAVSCTLSAQSFLPFQTPFCPLPRRGFFVPCYLCTQEQQLVSDLEGSLAIAQPGAQMLV